MFKPTTFWMFLFVFICNTSLLCQETVYIKSKEFGRGIIKERGGECFVIAPYHVVQGSEEDTVKVTGDKFVISKAVYVQNYMPDIVILRIIGGGQQYCPQWKVNEDYSTIIKESYEGYLEIRDAYGGLVKPQMYITGNDRGMIEIEPKTNAGRFKKGMSGSSLFTKYNGRKIYLGMLLEVADGKGVVLQADNIERTLVEFFEPNRDNKELTTEEAKDASSQKKKYLEGEFKSHIKFIEGHFKELQNANPRHLIRKFNAFLHRMDDVYSEYPEELNLPSQEKYQYLRLIGEISDQIEICKKLIEDSPGTWDMEAVPQISVFLYKLEEIVPLVSN